MLGMKGSYVVGQEDGRQRKREKSSCGFPGNRFFVFFAPEECADRDGSGDLFEWDQPVSTFSSRQAARLDEGVSELSDTLPGVLLEHPVGTAFKRGQGCRKKRISGRRSGGGSRRRARLKYPCLEGSEQKDDQSVFQKSPRYWKILPDS